MRLLASLVLYHLLPVFWMLLILCCYLTSMPVLSYPHFQIHGPVFARAGMPVSKSPGTKGDMLIKFQVTFPSSMSDDKKRQLRAILT